MNNQLNLDLEEYLTKTLGGTGHINDYSGRFIQAHLAKWCVGEEKLSNKDKKVFLKAIALNLPFKSTLRKIIQNDLTGKIAHKEQLKHYFESADDLFRNVFQENSNPCFKNNPQKKKFLKQIDGSKTFTEIFTTLRMLLKGDITKTEGILDRLLDYLEKTQLIITNSGGSGHKSASNAYKEISKNNGCSPIILDIMNLMNILNINVGEKGAKNWNKALRNGNHDSSRFAFFSFINLCRGNPSTGDLRQLDSLSSFLISVKSDFEDLFSLFGIKNPIISTQPQYLKEIISIKKRITPNSKVIICLTDPPTNESFWLPKLKELIDKGYQYSFKVLSPKIVENEETSGFYRLIKSGLQTIPVTSNNTYFRSGIEIVNKDKATEDLKQAGMSDPQIENYEKQTTLLLSVGSNANLEHIQSIIKELENKYEMIAVLCASNNDLKETLNNLENKKIVSLSNVNDYSMGYLTANASGIVITGGGMTMLEILRMAEKKSFKKGELNIYYIIPGDENLKIRPSHERSSLDYLGGIVDGGGIHGDTKIDLIPIKCGFEGAENSLKSRFTKLLM